MSGSLLAEAVEETHLFTTKFIFSLSKVGTKGRAEGFSGRDNSSAARLKFLHLSEEDKSSLLLSVALEKSL